MAYQCYIIEWDNEYGIRESTIMSKFEWSANGWIFNSRNVVRRDLYESRDGDLVRIEKGLSVRH